MVKCVNVKVKWNFDAKSEKMQYTDISNVSNYVKKTYFLCLLKLYM